MYVESVHQIEIFGLDLESPALLKIRLCASETNRGEQWSRVVNVRFELPRDVFDGEHLKYCSNASPEWMR
jgi:hypothetical protein